MLYWQLQSCPALQAEQEADYDKRSLQVLAKAMYANKWQQQEFIQISRRL
jgi:hypothetical protein